MKYYSIIAALLLSLGVFIACEDTNEDPVKQRGANVVANLEFTSAPVFTTNIAQSFVEFTVSLNEGETADGGSIEVTYNGEKATSVYDITSFPANIHLDAADIISKMGIDASKVTTSDVFTVFALTSKNGVKTRSIAAANIKIVCDFTPSISKGVYNVVSEGWDAQGVVTLEADPNDMYKITVKGFENIDGVSGVDDLVFQINKASFAIDNKDAFVLSNDLDADWGTSGYGQYVYKIVSGSYNSCDGTYNITFNISCTAGTFGNYDFTFSIPKEDDGE